ncbi:MAG: septum formation initiator family protein [Lachnospiraceae bacterium]|nr:septum formation initiator family protein [Lachnospiraceae bacterium]
MAGRVFERKKRYRSGMIAVFLVVLLLFAVVMLEGKRLEAKDAAYAKKEQQLQAQIDKQYEFRESLNSYSQYTKTKKYIEEIAREKFGLVYPDEIVFKAVD